MRLICVIAIVLCLSPPITGVAAEQQDPVSTANPGGQAQTLPVPKDSTPAEQVPPETAPAKSVNPQTPAAEEKTPEKGTKTKKDTGSTSSTRKRHKPSPPAPEGAPRKIVVREGGASEPAAQIAPDITPAEAAHQRQNAERLLVSTDDQVKRQAGRTLDAQQQQTVEQIRNYMGGARAALKEGDVRRANTLAQKAHLLAEDLVKH
jgi:hypothetical protein